MMSRSLSLSGVVREAEDSAFMLQEKPGSYFFIGNGASESLHHPKYITNQEILPIGANF